MVQSALPVVLKPKGNGTITLAGDTICPEKDYVTIIDSTWLTPCPPSLVTTSWVK